MRAGEACVQELTQIHQVVYRAIGDELLWCGSMPCNLPSDDAIPLGQFGTSNVGRAKHVYRMGLSHRYGRRMQTISGIHYNFSLPVALSNEAYFALIRNFRRHSWLLLYLFGASPAVCGCFVEGRDHELQRLSDDTYYLPYATSLRMGRLGYQSDAQSALAVSNNSLDSYGASLQGALTRPYPPYEAIGIRDGDDYRQLAVSLLQIENEFYSTIRPKRRIKQGERPLHALRERGVEYVEVRLMDLDPFRPVGIVPETMRMLDVYLLYCLLSDSPPDNPAEIAEIGHNQQRVAARGREPGLELERVGASVSLLAWGKEILDECAVIAEALDAAHGTRAHGEALADARRLLDDPSATPSARVLPRWRRGTTTRTPASSSRSRSRTARRSARCRSPTNSPRALPRWPRSRARSSARSRRATRCPSRSTGSSIWIRGGWGSELAAGAPAHPSRYVVDRRERHLAPRPAVRCRSDCVRATTVAASPPHAPRPRCRRRTRRVDACLTPSATVTSI